MSGSGFGGRSASSASGGASGGGGTVISPASVAASRRRARLNASPVASSDSRLSRSAPSTQLPNAEGDLEAAQARASRKVASPGALAMQKRRQVRQERYLRSLRAAGGGGSQLEGQGGATGFKRRDTTAY